METAEYSITLRDGENAGKEQYFSAPKDKIQSIFDSFGSDNNGVSFGALAHIAGNDIKHGETEDTVKINKKKRLVEFNCKNEQTANKCVNYWELGVPFDN